MYYPFLRGKQYELILLRDNVAFLKKNNVHPIIEPVKSNTTALKKALLALGKEGVEHTLIVNPQVGDYSSDYLHKNDFLYDILQENTTLSIGYLLHAKTELKEVESFLANRNLSSISLIHYGFSNAKDLIKTIGGNGKIKRHIFIDNLTSRKLYQLQFKHDNVLRILIRDGFRLQKKMLIILLQSIFLIFISPIRMREWMGSVIF